MPFFGASTASNEATGVQAVAVASQSLGESRASWLGTDFWFSSPFTKESTKL